MEAEMKYIIAVAVIFGASPSLASTTLISDLRVGQTATITGTVERVTDTDEFRLADETGSVRVYIGPNIIPFDVGEMVTINGIVDRDFGRIEVYARSAQRENGSTVSFNHRYE